MPGFVHLHNHSEYSLLDGISMFPRIIERLKELKQNAFALTDHGNLYGAVDFFTQMKAAELHPIIGCELYLAPRKYSDRESDVDRYNRHLVLLCENMQGYRNLIKLVTIASTVGYYYRPRIDFEVLSEHHEGLIALTGCLSGVVSATLKYDGEDAADAVIAKYEKLFGKERFFLELQDHGIPDEAVAAEYIIDRATKMGVQMAATNDTHYVEAEDAGAHDTALCLQTRTKADDADRLRYSGPYYYIKSAAEMLEKFPHQRQALANTVKIAQMCDVEILDKTVHFPSFTAPSGESSDEELKAYLRELAYQGAKERYGEPLAPAVNERMEEELEVITSTGFTALFLIVWDLMRHARERKIPVGPGRGSAAGSLVSYCLYITKLDPLAHGLFFERFLNKERVELPDFDLDFCYERREEMIDYVKQRYGEGNVAQIITFSKLKARAVVKAVGRVKEIPYTFTDRITKLMGGLGMSIRESVDANPELATLLRTDKDARELVEAAEKLEGLASHVSVHAAGVVVADKPLMEYVPLRSVKDTTMQVTQYEMGSLPKVGMIKFDFLGLKTLTQIEKCLNYVREIEGRDIDIDEIPFDDQDVYANIYWAGNCFGVFQFERPHIVRVMRETHPNSIEDLTALNALNRPGPMQAGMIPQYIANRKDPDKSRPPLPVLEPIFAPTNGVLLYQEQVMQIAASLAGYTLGDADVLRKAMGKKIVELMGQHKVRFLEGAAQRGHDKARTLAIWEMMEGFARYGFNKAHSACYAYLSYQTAYLKHYYPHHFMAGLMNTYIHDSGKLSEALADCQKQGIEVVPPSANLSKFDFISDEQGRIIFGLGGIKHIGRAAVDEIERVREAGGPFTSVEDFLERVDGQKANKSVLEFMVRAGCFDEFGADRGELLRNLESFLSQRIHHNQIAMFGGEDSPQQMVSYVSTPEEIARMEKESIGVYLTHNPYESAAVLRDKRVMQISELLRTLEERGAYFVDAKVKVGGVLDEVQTKVSRRKQQYALAKLCSADSSVNVIVGPGALEKCASLLQNGNEVIISATVALDDMVEETAEDLISALKLYTGELVLYRGNAGNGVAHAANGGVNGANANGDGGAAQYIDGAQASGGSASLTTGGKAVENAQACRRLLIKFTRVPDAAEIAQMREKLGAARGECAAYLLIPANEGGMRKIALGPQNTLDPAKAKAALAGMGVFVSIVQGGS